MRRILWLQIRTSLLAPEASHLSLLVVYKVRPHITLIYVRSVEAWLAIVGYSSLIARQLTSSLLSRLAPLEGVVDLITYIRTSKGRLSQRLVLCESGG